MEPKLREAIDSLPKGEFERLRHAFDLGEASFVRVKPFENLYVGVHLDQLDFMDLVESEGKWALGRKKHD